MPTLDEIVNAMLEINNSDDKEKILRQYTQQLMAEAQSKAKSKTSRKRPRRSKTVPYNPVTDDPFPKVLEDEEVRPYIVRTTVTINGKKKLVETADEWGESRLPCPFCEELHTEYDRVQIHGLKYRCRRCGYTAALLTAPCGCVGLEKFDMTRKIIHNEEKVVLVGQRTGYCIIQHHVPPGLGLDRYHNEDNPPDITGKPYREKSNFLVPNELPKIMFFAPFNSSRRNLRVQPVLLFNNPKQHSNVIL